MALAHVLANVATVVVALAHVLANVATVVVATGPRIRTEVNGVPAVDFSGAADRSGFIGLQIHRTDLADSLEVRWRRLRIREREAE